VRAIIATPELIEIMKRMESDGLNCNQIAVQLGLRYGLVYYHLNATFREKQREYYKRRRLDPEYLEAHRKRCRENNAMRAVIDDEYVEQRRRNSREWRYRYPEKYAAQLARRKDRYASDEAFRKEQLERGRRYTGKQRAKREVEKVERAARVESFRQQYAEGGQC